MKTGKAGRVQLEIPNSPEFLAVVRLVVSGYVSRLNVPYDEVENIKVAVSEACNNAIQYAYIQGEEGTVRLVCWNEDDRIVFEVKDTGQGVEIPGKTDELPGPEEDDRGLGFLLIRTLMDDVKVTSRPGRGTRVLMTKHLGKKTT